jgi:fructose-1,6-bisphosphatase/sedoheptulose 1,7-bisphosphatase-like protein
MMAQRRTAHWLIYKADFMMQTSSPNICHHAEGTFELEFLRATENAALQAVSWLGRGEKERADAAACDAIYGAFDLPNSGVDLYLGVGGSPEAVLTAAALKTLGGEMLVRPWPRDEAERQELLKHTSGAELKQVYLCGDLIKGDSAIFCATGISDSALLPGVKLTGHQAVTSSILMRTHTRTVRYIRAVHDLDDKRVPLRSQSTNGGDGFQNSLNFETLTEFETR